MTADSGIGFILPSEVPKAMQPSQTEELIRSVVQQVLSQMGTVFPGGLPGVGSGRLGVFPTVDAAAHAARDAFQRFRGRPLADRRRAIDVIRKVVIEGAEELGSMELAETKIGRRDHKIEKLVSAGQKIPGVEYLRTDNVSGDLGITLTDYAPFGVVGAVTPVTHSLPTLAGNAINILAAGNTVVFHPHPSGVGVALEGVRRFNQGIREAIGLENLITIVESPTLESAQQLFDHREVDLLLVTGGPAVARAALSSRKRAIVAGPGNPPVVVDATACLDNAARSIVTGAAYDNNLLCIGEKQVFAPSNVLDRLMDRMARYGGHRLDARQIEALTAAAFKTGEGGQPTLNKELVGQDPAVLAAHAGLSIPSGVQLLFGETPADHPFVQLEQMMPFVPFVRTADLDQAIEQAHRSEHGYGHTAVLHSRDTATMTRMGRLMNCTIFVINGPCTAGLGGGGEGVLSYSIAGPTGEGVTTPLTFCRQQRTAVVGAMRFL
nr:aldehyde dehydrogenase [Isosphaera pallida]